MRVADIKPLRRIVLAFLKKAGWNVTLRNPWAPEYSLRLNLYAHKGYWWQGKSRERQTMEAFARMIKPGQTVIEVGGHIGYITQYFAHLVGPRGQVVVFEPGPNNLPYLEANICDLRNAILEKRAVADKDGEVSFFVEDVTGQNNSIIDDYDMFLENRAAAFSSEPVHKITVPCVKMDSYVDRVARKPDFMKIDAEGAEYLILSGMEQVLEKDRPIIMVELTRNVLEVVQLFGKHAYVLKTLQPDALEKKRPGNVFAFPVEKSIAALWPESAISA